MALRDSSHGLAGARDQHQVRGVDRRGLELRRVETPEDAERERFLGSPTVRIDGEDVDPTAQDRNDFGLDCRLYRTEEGLVRTPPESWIRAKLDRAA